MSGNGSEPGPLIFKAVRILKASPNLSVPQAMRAAGMTMSDSKLARLQMQVRRRMPAASRVSTSPPPSSIHAGSPNTAISAITTATGSTVSTASSAVSNASQPKYPAPKSKQKRMSGLVKQRARADKKAASQHASKAHKHATAWYAREKAKGNDGLSAASIAKKTKEQFDGVGPSTRTIQQYVKDGLVASSPKKKGAKGKIPDFAFQTLCSAFHSFVAIHQINGKSGELNRKKLRDRINRVMGRDSHNLSFKLLDRILAETAIDLHCSKVNDVEERRILWTTYKNLKMWFNNWKLDLLNLGFATQNLEGDVTISENQLYRIINLDETCLSLDGSKGNRGGRPEVTFFDPRFPQLGKGTSKSAMTTTMIGGSNAAGEALPPHFQFQTKATTPEKERMRTELAVFMPNVVGTFGNTVEKAWPVTYGMNEKGGMDNVEFEMYIFGSIVALYPDAKDEDGKRVMIKVDSGPGRIQEDLLARLKLLGFVLYPGVPNTTAVSQETDRNYGPFKTQFRANLEYIVQARIDNEMSLSLQPWLVGLMVFGGKDPLTNYELERSAYEVGFSRAHCLLAWAKVGAAPLTMACLDDPQVRREKGDGSAQTLMHEIQDANDLGVYQLTQMGYVAINLRAKLIPTKTVEPITQPHTQERIELLAAAHTHGAKFTATGGSHLTTDDFFKSIEIPKRKKEIREMETDKENRILKAKIEEEAREVLALAIPLESPRVWHVPMLNKILLWHGNAAKDLSKMGKEAKFALVRGIIENNTAPPAYEKWAPADEERLLDLKKMKIEMGDTAVGRVAALRKRELLASVPTMDEEEREVIRRKLDLYDGTVPTAI